MPGQKIFSRVNKLNFVYNFSPVFFHSFCPLIRWLMRKYFSQRRGKFRSRN
jgi:hypothetical protein